MVLWGGVLAMALSATVPSLPELGVNSTATVSGLSAGAFMAVQYHVSYSSCVSGVGVFAGGPFFCAEDNVYTALHACMVAPAAIDVNHLGQLTRNAEAVLSIDQLDHLRTADVFIFSGSNDTVVVPGVAPRVAEFYALFTEAARIKSVLNVPAEHAIPTAGWGNPCGFKGTPYINNCGFDGAFAALSHSWPTLVRAANGTAKMANLRRFDQAAFFASGAPRLVGMDTVGYVYIPTPCAGGSISCRLHIAFHGCEQGTSIIGDTFARYAGYNDHAERNNIVVLYPQAYKVPGLNPKGCFDWWGYTGADYACKLGSQLQAVRRMHATLAKPRL